MPHNRYQTVQELAERLEVAEATVRQWVKSGLVRVFALLEIAKQVRLGLER